MNFKHTLIIIPNSNKRLKLTGKEINFIKKNKIQVILPKNLINKKINKNYFIFFNYSKETVKKFTKFNIYSENFLYDLMENLYLNKIYFIKITNFSSYNLKNFFQNEVLYEHKFFNKYKYTQSENRNKILINLKDNIIITLNEYRWILVKEKNYKGLILTFFDPEISQFAINHDQDFAQIYLISKYYKGLIKYFYRFLKFLFQKREIVNLTFKNYILYKYFLKLVETKKKYVDNFKS